MLLLLFFLFMCQHKCFSNFFLSLSLPFSSLYAYNSLRFPSSFFYFYFSSYEVLFTFSLLSVLPSPFWIYFAFFWFCSLTLSLSRPLIRSSHINAFKVHCCQCRFSLFSIIFPMYQSTVGLMCHVTDSNLCVFFICVLIVFIEFLFSFQASTWFVVILIIIVFFAFRIYLIWSELTSVLLLALP